MLDEVGTGVGALKDQTEDSAEPDPRRGKAVSFRLIHATDILPVKEPVDDGYGSLCR